MPYLGTKGLKASDIRRFNVTGSTSATHTLTWVAPTEQSLIVTINGVKQQEDAYSVSGTTLTLSSALVATDKMEVVGINDVGTTVTPAQNSVNLDKLATTGTPSSSTFLRGDMAWIAVSDTSGLSSVQTFTSSGTWTRPSGITKVVVEVQGAGGSGNDATNQNGISGAYSKKFIDVSSISTATVTVGAGGATATGSAATGNDGGLSSWVDGTNTVSCMGGYGGGKLSTLASTPIVASGGDINVNSAAFGNPIYGRMGIINSTIPGVRDATGYGAGGGGNYSSYTGDSGAGSDGIVIVTEYK